MDGEDAIPLLERKDREADSDHESEGPVEEEQNSVVDEGSSLTARVWILGSLLCVMGSAISQLFFFKSNAPSFSSFFIILISLPLGRGMAAVLPTRRFSLFAGRISFTLNPGPFTRKEHLLLTVMAASGASAAYAGEIISVQELYYHQRLGHLPSLLLLLSSQMIGFGLAGLMYRLLVRPAKMVWPSTLVFVSLFDSLHAEGRQRAADQMRLFNVAFIAIFCYQFFPAFIFPTLTSIATLCIFSNSPLSSILSSGYDGFGFLNFSLDWTVIGSMGPLYTPFFAQASFFGGFAVSMWFVVPLLYFGDFWSARSFDSPLAAHLYNSTFGRFDVQSVVTPTLSLDVEKFDQVSPLLLTPYFALCYGVSFAILASAISTVLLWHLPDIKDAFFSVGKADAMITPAEDYDSVPNRWYFSIFGVTISAAIFLVARYPLQLPVAGLALAVLLALVSMVPIGIIAAITGTTLGLNVISEFIAGFIYEGLPLANVTFKVYSYMALVQALDLVADMKLGLYSKIPPKSLFISQCYGTALGATVNLLLIRSVIDSKRSFLDGTEIDPSGQWTGRKPAIFFSASAIFGLVGPVRFFADQYRVLYLGFPIGFALPFIPWYLHRRYPNSFWRSVSVPLILQGSIAPPQAPTNIIFSGFLASYLAQYFAVRHRPKWAEKYLCILSSALDAGTSTNALAIYLFLGSTKFYEWWGNSAIDTEHCRPGS